MHNLVFYLVAVSLYSAGACCLRNTNPYSRSGGDHYLRRDRRRLIAKTLLALATMSLATGLIVQFIATYP
jgi:hypothetical protein